MKNEAAIFACHRCGGNFPPEGFNSGTVVKCACSAEYAALVFPAIFKRLEGEHSESAVETADSTCYVHPDKKAVSICESCGVFVCALCDIHFEKKHLCPSCMEKGVGKLTADERTQGRKLYGRTALSLSILPLLMWPLTIITAPAAFFLAIWSWKKPESLVRPGKGTHIGAILLSSLQIALWITLIGYQLFFN